MTTGTDASANPKHVLARSIAKGALDAHTRGALARRLVKLPSGMANVLATYVMGAREKADLLPILNAYDGVDFDTDLELDLNNFRHAVVDLKLGSLGPKVPALLANLTEIGKEFVSHNHAGLQSLSLNARWQFLKSLAEHGRKSWSPNDNKRLALHIFQKSDAFDKAEVTADTWSRRGRRIAEAVPANGGVAQHVDRCLLAQWPVESPQLSTLIHFVEDVTNIFQHFTTDAQTYLRDVLIENISLDSREELIEKLKALVVAWDDMRGQEKEFALSDSHAEVVSLKDLVLTTSQLRVLVSQSSDIVVNVISGTNKMHPSARVELIGEWLDEGGEYNLFGDPYVVRFAALYDEMWQATLDHEFFDALAQAVEADAQAAVVR